MGNSGWRDVDGNTATDRRKRSRHIQLAGFADRVKHRPLSLVRPLLIALFFAVLIFAVAMRYIG